MKKVLSLLLVLLLCVGMILLIYFEVDRRDESELTEIRDQIGKTVSVTDESEGKNLRSGFREVISILLAGTDSNDRSAAGENGDPCEITLVSFNPKTGEVVFTSFMPDIRVCVNDSRFEKLAAVCRSDEIELLEKTFEDNFGIHVDNYVLFDYADMIDIVDSLGAAGTAPNSEEGDHASGGTERARETASDLIRKLYKMELKDMIRFGEVLVEKTKTDISADRMLQFAMNAKEIKAYKHITDRIPIDGSYTRVEEDTVSYIVPDFDINNRHLLESVFEGEH